MKKFQNIGIIGAMDAEIESLKNALHQAQTHTIGTMTVYTGQLDGQNVCLSLSGIGKVNAAIATTLLIQHFQVDAVINTGSAGALHSELSIGDVVLGKEIAHHDVDVTAFGYAHGQVPRLTARFASDDNLLQHAHAAAHAQQLSVHSGCIVSGDQFIHDDAVRQNIIAHFPDVWAVEMEAAAIAQTCTVLNTPFVIVRAISDTADGSASASFETFLQTAAVQSAQMVRALIGKLHL